MAEIARLLRISTNKVSYWMDRYNLKRRSINEAIYLKKNPTGDPFFVKINLNQYELFLLALGLGLFWGEGMKKSSSGVRLGNTDPYMIVFFREFLEKVCGVKREKINYSLQLFGDVDKNEALQFWCDILSITPKKLGKISMVKLRGNGTYKKKNTFGVLQIACHNKKLKEIIDNLLRTLKISIYADVAQMVEHVHGETHKSFAQMLGN